MTLTRSLLEIAALSTLAACGGASGAGDASTSTGVGGNAGSGAAAGSGGATAGVAGSGGGDRRAGGGGGSRIIGDASSFDASCAARTVDAQPIPGDLFGMLDRSGWMNWPAADDACELPPLVLTHPTRWDAVATGLT